MCVCNNLQIRMYMKYAIKYETKYIFLYEEECRCTDMYVNVRILIV